MHPNLNLLASCLSVLLFSLLAATGLAAQKSAESELRIPFLSKAESDFLTGEVSGDRSFEHIRWYTHWHRPFASEGLMAAAQYTERQLREMGLPGVKLTKTPFSGIEWTAKRGELWLLEPSAQKLCDIGSVQLHLLDRSRSADVTAEIIDVGAGTAAADFEGKNVEGKITLAFGSPSTVMREAVWKRKAAGIIVRPDPTVGFERPDQVRWLSIPDKSEDGTPATFAFGLSHRQGEALAANCKKGAVRAHAVVEAEIGPGWLVIVEATIPGTDPTLPCVVMTGHLQEERFSANDDASGCANTLEGARALALGIAAGKLPRPRRSIRFWWTTEIQSEDEMFAKNPELASTILCNVNQDMVGAHQQQATMRVQNVTRLPWSRAHVLETVAEDIVNFLVTGNTAQLASRQRGIAGFPFPVYSKLGTRDRYNARFVPYHANTDHQCFVAPAVGIPAITFTNWPDDFIHTSDDDLPNIDATQLQRNALAAASIAYVMARLEPEDEEMLTMLARASGSRRMGEDTEAALRLIRDSPLEKRGSALRSAIAHVDASVRREIWTLDSIATVTSAASAPTVDRIRPTLAAHKVGIRALLEAAAGTAVSEPSATEVELATLHPRRIGTIAESQERRGKAQTPTGLHSLLAHEILCLADAAVRRSVDLTGADIHNIVSAQARSAGTWYYGEVTPEMTLEFLKSCNSAGLIEITPQK